MRVLYQNQDTPLELYRCRHSGRFEYNLTDAAQKARWLVRNGHATNAVVMDGEQVKAQWIRRGTETIKISGPDL